MSALELTVAVAEVGIAILPSFEWVLVVRGAWAVVDSSLELGRIINQDPIVRQQPMEILEEI